MADEGTSVGTARVDIVVDTSQFDAAINQARRSVSGMSQAAQAAYNQMSAAQRRQVDGLIRQADQLNLTRSQQIAYNAALRGLPTSVLDELKNKLAAAEQGTERLGMSARATAAAMRQVPAQVTDIVTGLATGQAPFTVLLQQGGQLKDMFGGIVPAARALGTSVLGLVNPFTLSAGAAAVLALAYKGGAAETHEFNKQLILTGNNSGETAQSLSDLARSISQTGVSQGSAARVLTQVVSSGKIASDSYREVTEAALDLEKLSGQAADKTLSVFERLADEPTKASAALNDQYHYLTASVYEQIAALERQGDKDQAAALAQKTYANAIIQRTAEVKANMGTLERAWDSLGAAAKSAWDAMLNIGRPTPIADLKKQAQAIQDQIAQLQSGNGFDSNAGGAAFGGGGNARAQALKRLQTQLAPILQQIADDEKKSADARAAAEVQATNDAKIAAQTYIDNLRQSTRSRDQIRKDEVKRVQDDAKTLGLSAKETQDLIDQVNTKYKDPAGKQVRDDGATRMLATLKEQAAALQDQLNAGKAITSQQSDLVKFNQQIADLKGKTILTADQKSLLANQDAIRAQLQQNAALGQKVQAQKESLQLEQRIAQIQVSIASAQQSQQEQYDRQLAGAGLSSQDQERLRAQQTLVTQYQRYQDQLTKATPKDLLGSAGYREAAQTISDQLDAALKSQQDYYRQVDQQQSDWQLGFRRAYADYAQTAQNYYQQAGDVFKSVTSGMEDALTSFVTTGKLSFKSFANSIIADLARIAARKAIAGIAGEILGVVGAGSGAAAAPTADQLAASTQGVNAGLPLAFDGGGYTGAGGKYDVAGIVHRGEVVWSQDDIARAGGVSAVEAMRQGHRGYAEGGVVGRSSAPISSMGGGNMTTNVEVNVSVDSSGGVSVTGTDAYKNMGAMIGQLVRTEVQNQITRSNQPGGISWKYRNNMAR